MSEYIEVILALYHTILTFDNPEKQAFQKYCGKRRKCWLPAIPPFHTMFSTLSKTEIIILATCILSSSNAFNLVTVKILSFDKGLTLSQTSPGFYVSAVQVCRKHYGKSRNCS